MYFERMFELLSCLVHRAFWRAALLYWIFFFKGYKVVAALCIVVFNARFNRTFDCSVSHLLALIVSYIIHLSSEIVPLFLK